jgi:hypothetical protein
VSDAFPVPRTVMVFDLWPALRLRMHRDAPSAPFRSARAPGGCRFCGQALSALARVRGDVCDAMDCRRRAADDQSRARRAADLDRARAAAASAWDAPALARAPVLWLRHHDADLAPANDVDVAELRAHLMALEVEAAPAPPRDTAAAEGASPAIDGHLCALCRGRCCRFGLHGKAFIEAHQLRAWLAQHPGSAWADAVDHWLGYVAPEHLHSSCVFHAATGCALPRERRSDVCNQFACDTLEQLRGIVAADADAAVVVGIVATQVLHGAALVSAQGSRPLPDRPAQPQLP